MAAYVLWLVGIWIRRQGKGAFSGLPGLGVRVLLSALPAAAVAWWCTEQCMQTLALPHFLKACAALAAGGSAFLAVFAALAWRLAPEVLKLVWKRSSAAPRPTGHGA